MCVCTCVPLCVCVCVCVCMSMRMSLDGEEDVGMRGVCMCGWGCGVNETTLPSIHVHPSNKHIHSIRILSLSQLYKRPV